MVIGYCYCATNSMSIVFCIPPFFVWWLIVLFCSSGYLGRYWQQLWLIGDKNNVMFCVTEKGLLPLTDRLAISN